MPNPGGKNGYGEKNYPPDEILRESLLKYARQSLQQKDKIVRLQEDHQLSIGTSILNKLERRLQIPSVRRTAPLPEVARQAILDEVDKDLAANNGPRYIHQKLKNKGIMIPRDEVRSVMMEDNPRGFDQRFPGRNKAKIPRRGLTSIGAFHEISSDGHEKLGVQALKMGNIGLPIYAYKDKWTANLLKINVIPDCRSAGAIGHLFLDFITETGCIPIQVTTDKGSEVGWQYAIQCALRENFAPDIDPEAYWPCALLKSVHNTVIEAFWRWLKEKSGINMKTYILRGKEEHIFNPNIPIHTHLFNWIFPPLVQAELDEFRTWWNNHTIRSQSDKEMLSGHVPEDAVMHPSLYGGLDCRIRIPMEVVNDLREYLDSEVGSRATYLCWVTPEFSRIAEALHKSLGSPKITWNNAWDMFTQMSNALE